MDIDLLPLLSIESLKIHSSRQILLNRCSRILANRDRRLAQRSKDPPSNANMHFAHDTG